MDKLQTVYSQWRLRSAQSVEIFPAQAWRRVGDPRKRDTMKSLPTRFHSLRTNEEDKGCVEVGKSSCRVHSFPAWRNGKLVYMRLRILGGRSIDEAYYIHLLCTATLWDEGMYSDIKRREELVMEGTWPECERFGDSYSLEETQPEIFCYSLIYEIHTSLGEGRSQSKHTRTLKLCE
jgi:hypothetical protein